jgi:hypothetical protein
MGYVGLRSLFAWKPTGTSSRCQAIACRVAKALAFAIKDDDTIR